MNWVSAQPFNRTGFEQFLIENFGIYADLSQDSTFAAVAAIVVMLPFAFAWWNQVHGR